VHGFPPHAVREYFDPQAVLDYIICVFVRFRPRVVLDIEGKALAVKAKILSREIRLNFN
jgi:hypothetical protein